MCKGEWKFFFSLHEGGDVDSTNNYRPISILPVVSKIIEIAVHNHASAYVTQNCIINCRSPTSVLNIQPKLP